MLDMGFLPTIKSIMAAMPSDRQTMFFSATIETSVKHLVETHVRNAVRIEVGSTTKPIEQVDLHLYEVEQDRKLGLLESMLREEDGLLPGLRPHQARRRPAVEEALARRREDRGHPRRPQPEPAQPGAARVPGGIIPRPGGDRRRSPRHSRGRDLARGELRPSASSGGLHSPRGPHGARRRTRERLRLSPRAPSARTLRTSSGPWTPGWCDARYRPTFPGSRSRPLPSSSCRPPRTGHKDRSGRSGPNEEPAGN